VLPNHLIRTFKRSVNLILQIRMCKLKIPLVLQCLVFLVPINYFVIGNGIGNGIQLALFRYQQDVFGTNFYSVTDELLNAVSGVLPANRVLAALLWVIGTSLLIGSFCLHVLNVQKKRPGYVKYAAIVTLIGGVIFLASDIARYGLLFQGPDGFCIPLGIPFIFLLGGLGLWYADKEGRPEPNIAESPRSPVINELILIVFISIFVKIIVFSVSMFPAIVWVHQDVNLYYSYADSALSGKIPYIDYMIEYPQFFLIPVFIAEIPALVLHNSALLFHSFMLLMYFFDTATLVCVYLIARKLFGPEKALLCGLLYATAFAPAFLVTLTYDSVPVFLLMLSVLLFVYGKEIPAYIAATAGTLSKWFPIFCIPYYILYSLKNKEETGPMKKGLFFSLILVLLSTVPFLILNYQAFLKTYLFHVGREAYPSSFIFYLDAISKALLNVGPFVNLSLILLVCVECALVYWYYKHLDGKPLTLCYLICLSVFCFILLNKVFPAYYMVWIIPFLALFFVNSWRQIVLFYVIQLVMYFEEPILMGRVVDKYSLAGNWLPNAMSFDPFSPDPVVFYSVKFAVLFIALYVLIRDLHRTQVIEKDVKTD